MRVAQGNLNSQYAGEPEIFQWGIALTWKKKGEIDYFTFECQLFLIKKERPVEQITVAMDNSNGDESSFLLLTSSIIACMTFLCGEGRGRDQS